MLLFSLSLLACRWGQPPADPGIGQGTWLLEAQGTRGVLAVEEGRCRIGLWGGNEAGAAWATGGAELKDCEVEPPAPPSEGQPPGAWIYFPLRSGAGEATAAGRLDPDDPVLYVPLGAHELEGQLALRRTPGSLGEAERIALAGEAQRILAEDQAGWARGEVALLDGERLVGELHLGEQAQLAVYDETWLTDGVVEATWASDGPVMVFLFPVMPTLEGEEGMIRVNPVTREVRVPLGPLPTPGDRRLSLALRTVSLDEATAAIERARTDSVAREQAISGELARLLSEELTRASGGEACRAPETLAGEWPIWLAGYEVRVARVEGVCEVVIDPDPVQHGRRLSVRARPEGVIEQVVRGAR